MFIIIYYLIDPPINKSLESIGLQNMHSNHINALRFLNRGKEKALLVTIPALKNCAKNTNFITLLSLHQTIYAQQYLKVVSIRANAAPIGAKKTGAVDYTNSKYI